MIKLNERLSVVASMVPKGANAIDVGCDHAYLAIYLKEHGIVNQMIASDNKEGPLKEAKKNIKLNKVDVKTSLADGVSKIDNITNTVIVSGMGGGNIIGMFKYTPEKLNNVDTLIFSPNNDVARLRREITKLGYHISNEKLVKYKNIIYPVLLFKKGKKHITNKECMFGPLLLKEKSPLFVELLKNDLKQKEILIKVLPKKYIFRKFQLKMQIKKIKEII